MNMLATDSSMSATRPRPEKNRLDTAFPRLNSASYAIPWDRGPAGFARACIVKHLFL